MKQYCFRFGSWTLVAAALTIGAVTPLAAASGDVFGQVGVVSIGDGGGTHGSVGGGASAMLGSHAALFGEFNYIPTGDYGVSMSGVDVSSKILQFGAGVRAYIPTGVKNVKMYVPIAGGLLRWSFGASASGISVSQSATGGYFGGGFGAEIGGKFGIRPEFRYSRYQLSFQGISAGSNVVTVGAGIFYRFGGE